ncbi:MAG: ABC transporter permease [Terriglobales bacterium]
MRQDLQGAWRIIRRHRLLSAVIILTMALAIGASTAIFSLADAVLFRPLPVHDPQNLLLLQWQSNGWLKNQGPVYTYEDCNIPYADRLARGCTFSPAFLRELRQQAHTLASVTALGMNGSDDLVERGQAASIHDLRVAGNFFQVMGLHPAAGRLLAASDDRAAAPAVMVLSYAYWRQHFNADPGVIGSTVRLNRKPVTIVGVAPRGFSGLTPGANLDAWIPLSTYRHSPNWSPVMDQAGSHWLLLVGRARAGISTAAVQAEVSGLFADLMVRGATPLASAAEHPRVVVLQAHAALAGAHTQLRQPLVVLLWLVGAVLLIACANIAGLLTARVRARGRELALRRALGASGFRMARQLLTESLVLAFAGGIAGLGLAWLGNRALLALVASGMPGYRVQAPLDGRVLLFALAATVAAGVLSGMAPALTRTGCRLQVTGYTEQGRRKGLGHGLVVAQVALCVLVLAGAGLLVRTLENLRSIPTGINTGNLLLFQLDPGSAGYKDRQILDTFTRVQRGIAALPGVDNVSYSQHPLLDGASAKAGVRVSNRPGAAPQGSYLLAVGRNYFATMGMKLLQGRDFRSSDFDLEPASLKSPPPRAVVVNQLFVQTFLGPGAAIGREIGFDKHGEHPRYTIVGVVSNARNARLRQPLQPMLYTPDDFYATFVVRTAAAPLALLPAARRVVQAVAPDVPLLQQTTEAQVINRQLFRERLLAQLASLFGGLALLLAAIGMYALLAQEVVRRTREIGIRMALGAERQRVLGMVMARGAALAIAGIVLGLAGAVAATRYLDSMLYGVGATDPLTLGAAALILLVAALLACWLPARGATHVDPMAALRED